MANEVIIIHGDDGTVWTNYLDEQLTNCNTVNAKTFMQLDQNLFTSSAIDSRAETRILKADVVLVIITPGHMEYMFKNKRASYKHLVPTGVNGLMLFVGITEEEIIQPEHWTQTREKFPHYDKWGKVHYVDENSIKDLLEKIVEIMENTPENTQTNFSVIPTTLQCEEDNPMCVMIDVAIPENAEVQAVIRGTYLDESIPCKRVNPYTYTFVMPRSEEGEATIYMDVDGRSLGSQAKVFYKSYLTSSDTTAINELYCHLLDNLCKFMKSKSQSWKITLEEIDLSLSELFDHTVDLPVVGYEKLFGIYQYYTDEHGHSMIPTLAHLAAKYNLKELMARLQDLPHFYKVLGVTNKRKDTPKDVASKAGFSDLSDFIQEVEEQMEIYFPMVYGTNDKVPNYSNKTGYQNEKSAALAGVEPDVIVPYGAWEHPQSDTTTGRRHTDVIAMPPEENYMDMGSKIMTTGMTRSQSTSDSDSYQSVPDTDFRQCRAESDLPRSTSPPVPLSTSSSGNRGQVVETFGDKGDLVGIIERFKRGDLSMEAVEGEFISWQKAQGKHLSNSFEAKQARLKITKQELSKLKESTTTTSPAGKPKKKLFSNPFASRKTTKASGYVDVKKPISSSIKKKADYKPSAQPSAQASAQPEVLYIDRDQPRGTDRDQPRGTDRDQPRGGYTDRDKPDSFYTRGNKPEGEYVGRDAMAPPVPNRHGLSQYNPPVPPKQFTKDPNDGGEMYLGLEAEDGEGEDYEDPDSDKWVGAYRAPIALPRDDTGSNVGSNRNSNASSGSRTSARSSLGSSAGYSSSTSGVDEDYDAKQAKRASIRELKLPPAPPVTTHCSRRPMPPTPSTPDEYDMSSIPIDSPPPIPEPEPLTPQQIYRAKMAKLGAVNIFQGMQIPQTPHLTTNNNSRNQQKPRPPGLKPKPAQRPR